MAYVASNDQHGNEIMRVMLSTEPGKRTVASCQNLRINCSPARTQPDTRPGRYDHRHRFHYFADTTPSQRQDVRLLQEQHIDRHQQQRDRQQQEKLGLEKQQPDREHKKRWQQEKTQGQTQKAEQRQPEKSQSEKQPQPQRLQLERSHSEKKALSEKSQPKMQSQPELQSHLVKAQLVKSHLSKSQPENKSHLASAQPESHLEKLHSKKSHLKKLYLEKEYLEQEYLEKVNLDRAYSEKAYIENSYTERTYSEKSQPEKSQPEKLQPEKLQPEKSQPEKSDPEKSHVEKTYLKKSQPKKSQLEKTYSESSNLENSLSDRSLPEKPKSAKWKPEKAQPAKKPQPEKARSQMLYSEMNLEPDKKWQAVKLKPEKSQPEMPKPEKSQPVRSLPDKSLPDKSLSDKSLPDKSHLDKSHSEKKTYPEKSHSPKLQAEMSQPEKESQPEKHPQPEKKSHPEISQPEKLPTEKSQPEGKSQPEFLPPPKRAQPVKLQIQTKENLSVEELALWNSTEVIAHSTLLSTVESQDRIYRRGNSANALSESPDSPFYAWLAAKNELQQQLAMDRRLYSELEQQRAVERARLAQLKYERWIQAKTNQMRRAKSDLSSAQTTAKSRQSLPAEEAQRRLLEWEREKRAELKAQRLEREACLARQNLIDSTRRELSAEAWEQWVYATRNRPKPVAMGRGLDSLRASNAPHYHNPNEWQTLLPTARTGQQGQQPTQATAQVRSGPDYERLERLAQPRRKLWRQTINEPVRLTTKEYGVPAKTTATVGSGCGGEHNRDTERLHLSDAASQTQPEDAELTMLEKSRKAETTTDSCLLRPQRSPIIWSKSNAQRVREMRKVVQPSECGQGPRQLRDDQLEQLRKQQDMQNSKILPRKFQQKREQLRKKLKAWVEEGKALPERSLSDSCRNLKEELKQELRQELKQQQRRAVYVDEAANTQRHNARKMSLTESRIQRSEEQLQSIARKSIAPLQRARSTEPKRLLMGKESKEAQKSKPWR
ncbi:trichohyalin-like isoform X2 [Drosophila novamexicana]|uniref:trichohyalin-like isoform X2 n=1 Tax=Drosophila novamexicana TaxID=47314 RepID=UPI0011E5B6BB|nr:trichohyalin-like isoform X2 [Drosophila novamexicana]